MASSGKRVMSDAASGSRWQKHCLEFSLEEIEAFTDKFHPALFIAEGGFGKVFEGYIHSVSSEPDAAVKRLNKASEQGKREFEMEVKTLSQIHHPNLIKLLGYCRDKDEMVLVYEYMRNGTLADHLYKQSGTASRLSWNVRLNICLGAARGLAHLHEEVEPNIIHRDIKATNILLDGNMEAKVADFGMSKFMSEYQSHVSTAVKGTHGYLDPAYYNSGRLTKKSDVYALGVVFLQVICGRPALDNTLVPEQRLLSDWVQSCFDKGDIDEMVDPSLKGQISPDGLRMFIELALKCLVRLPEERPNMIQVVQSLEYVQEIEAQFTPPVGIVRDRAFTRCSRLPIVRGRAFTRCSRLPAGIRKDPDQLEEGNEYDETPVHPRLQDLELQEEMEERPALKRIARICKEAYDDWFKRCDDIHGMPGLEDDQLEEGNEYDETPVHPRLQDLELQEAAYAEMEEDDQLEEGSPIQPMMVLTGNEYGETPVHLPLRDRTGRSFLALIRSNRINRRRKKGS